MSSQSKYDDIIASGDDNCVITLNINNTINNEKCGETVVKLHDVHYSYGKEKVLNGITMNITKGTIYGLLGASGCGKTTTLRLLLGISKPLYGTISIFGDTPGSSSSSIPGNGVGYMPQDIALSTLFSINESMIYFSKLTQMKSNITTQRMKHLSTLLKLPDGEREISKLSSGQKRRVSLAIALLHEPPLLILDEPTVGVDSLLRETIWDHLKEICTKNGQTIIITTHYIEEAKASHCIGLMRKGILLIEDNPQMIMQKTNESSLENAYLKLSYDHEHDPSKGKLNMNLQEYESKEINAVTNYSNINRCSTTIKSNYKTRTSALMSALIWKNIFFFKRNFILLLFYTTLIPLISQLAYTVSMGINPKDVPMALFNADSPPFTSKFIISNIDTTIINLIEFDTLSEAIESVKNYETYGVIYFPSNFTQSMQIAMFECDDGSSDTKNINYKNNDTKRIDNIEIEVKTLNYSDENEETINKELKMKDVRLMTQIVLLLDNTNQVMTRTVQKELYKTFIRVAEKTNKIFNDILTHVPIESPVKIIDPPIYGRKDTDLRDFFIYGFVVLSLFQLSLGFTGLMIIVERKDRIIERLYSNGIRTHHFMLSHLISQSFLCVIQVITSQLSIHFVFGYYCNGSLILSSVLFLLQSIFGVSFSLFLSCITNNENHAVFFLIGAFVPMVSISGLIWPHQAYPYYFRMLTKFAPQTLNLEAIRFVHDRGLGLSMTIVQLGLAVPIIWIIGLTILAIYFFNRNN